MSPFAYPYVQALLACLGAALALVVCAWFILTTKPKPPKRRPPATQSQPPATPRRRLVPLAFLAYGGRLLRARLAFRNRKGQA